MEKVPYIWVEVEDQGCASWDGILRAQPTHGLGIIERLATWMGTDNNDGNGCRTVYAGLQYRACDCMPVHDRAAEFPADLNGIRDDSDQEGNGHE
jgi:hypothetical protein